MHSCPSALTDLFPETVPARVTVHTRNDSYTRLVKYPEGDPANPMQWQKIENKLRRLSRPYRDSFDEKKVICAINNIEDGTIDALVDALGCPVSFNSG
jgi:2-methylcitrate dehydratase PrpD